MAIQDLDQATLQQILAMRSNPNFAAPGSGQSDYWYDPNKTYDAATDTHGYMLENARGYRTVGTGEGSGQIADPSQDRQVIRRLRAGAAGKLGDMWDPTTGKYLGEYQAQDGGGKQMNQAIALMAAGYFGGGALADAAAGTGAGVNAGAGATGLDFGAAAESGTLASGAGVNAGAGTVGTMTDAAGKASTAQQLTNATQGAGGGMTPQNWVDLAKVGTAVVGTVAASGDGGADGAQDRANSVSDAQLKAMQFALDQSKDLADYNRTTFRPVEQRLATEAMNYNTPGRMEAAAQEAAGRVASEFDTTRTAAQRDMMRYGVDPSTIQALGASSLIDEAKARAGAGSQARNNVEQQGWSRMADVANMGRNIASSQATQQQIGVRAGDSAVDGAATSAKIGQAEDAQLIQGIGQIGNFVGGLFANSDKNKKKGTGKMADAASALKQIERTPVHKDWTYKDDPKQTKHTGPMAQDVQRISGDKAAPGGKVIDLVNQQGRMMAAIKALSKDVKALKRNKEAA